MLPHQRQLWALPNFIKVLVAGFGAGKTILLCKWAIASGLENAPAPIAVVSPTFTDARRTLIPTMRELLAGKQTLLGHAFRWHFHETHHVFTVWYHGRVARIEVYSGEDPDRLRGPNLAAVGTDEPFIQKEAVFTHTMARIRHPAARRREMVLTGTPEQLNWGYELCVGDLREKNDVGVVRATSRDNPITVATGYVDRLETLYDEKTAQAYLDARFVSLSKGQVYYNFDPMENEVELARPEDAELGLGMDFNVNPMAMSVFWKRRGHIHFMREYELPNADTELACSIAREHWWDAGLRDVYPDATGHRRQTSAPGGKSDFHYIRAAGFKIHTALSAEGKPVNPERKDRFNAVNGRFKPRGSGVQLTISPQCKKLKKYLLGYAHETAHKQESMSHLLDAFSYPVAFLFPVYREVVNVRRLQGA